jgi:hypothetical protein
MATSSRLSSTRRGLTPQATVGDTRYASAAALRDVEERGLSAGVPLPALK